MYYNILKHTCTFEFGNLLVKVILKKVCCIVGKSDEGPVFQWEFTYNGWEYLHCEIKDLLNHISFGSGKHFYLLVRNSGK